MESAPKSGKFDNEREFISLLIDLYRDCPELWKVKSKDYFNRNKKCAALEKILDVLKAFKPDFTVQDLKKKINVLRTNFNREYRMIEQKKVSGASTDDIQEATLWYYNDLIFIKDQIEVAETETSEQLLPDENLHTELSPPTTPAPQIDSPAATQKKKKRPRQDHSEELVGLATAYFKQPDSEEDILAKGWAMKLKKLRPDQRRFAEKIINDTIFEAEMGTLTREGVRFLTGQRWSPSPPPCPSPSSSSSYSNHSRYYPAPHHPTSAVPIGSFPPPDPTPSSESQQSPQDNSLLGGFFSSYTSM